MPAWWPATPALGAEPNFKGVGLLAAADHGPAGSGKPLAIMLRPGNADSNRRRPHPDREHAPVRNVLAGVLSAPLRDDVAHVGDAHRG